MIADEKASTCMACGKPIKQLRGHRRRLYCSAKCRQREHRKQNKQSEQNFEEENKILRERLNIEERFRTDTQVRHFKAWIRSHSQPEDSDFFKRFLADTRLPQHASRSLYEAQLRRFGYTTEEIFLFQGRWKDMLFSQS